MAVFYLGGAGVFAGGGAFVAVLEEVALRDRSGLSPRARLRCALFFWNTEFHRGGTELHRVSLFLHARSARAASPLRGKIAGK